MPQNRSKRAASASSSFASPTNSTATMGSPFAATAPSPANLDSSTEDSSGSLARTFCNLTVKYPPAPAVESEYNSTAAALSDQDSTVKASFDSTDLAEGSSVFVDLIPSSPSDFSSFRSPPKQDMEPAMQPDYYLPVYHPPGQKYPIYGTPIPHVPGAHNPVSANVDLPAADEDTVIPLTSASTTPRVATSLLTSMDISSEPSDVTMRTASDNTVVSAPDVTMQSAVADITRQVDAIPTGGVSINGAEEVNEELFAPVQIAPFAKSCDGFTHGETTLGLPHRVYSEWNSQPYDNAWMEKAGVSEDKLDEFVSKVKMENLVLKSALKIGDELYTVVKDAEGVITAEKMARIVAFEKQGSGGKFPDMTLFVNGVQKGEIKGCTGPSKITDAFAELEPKTQPSNAAWKLLKVRRAGNELGTMYVVRQKFHRWEIEMDAWSKSTNTHTRHRRANRV